MSHSYLPLNIQDGSSVEDTICYHLFELARSMTSVVEIGSFYGKSTHALLSGCAGTVYAVDHFKGSTEAGDSTCGINGKAEFLSNCGKFNNLKLLEMDSSKAARQFKDNSVDMVFIDGGHLYEEISLDIKCWVPKARILVCGHDVLHEPVRKALREYGINYFASFANFWEYFKNAK